VTGKTGHRHVSVWLCARPVDVEAVQEACQSMAVRANKVHSLTAHT